MVLTFDSVNQSSQSSTMAKTTPQSIQQAVALLRAAAPKATIVIFGSRARGDARPDSDMDLLLIEPRLSSRRREMVRLRDVLRPLRLRVDILVISRRMFREWADVPGTVIHAAAKEGKVLHAAT